LLAKGDIGKMHIVIEEAELQDSPSIGSLIQNELGYVNLDLNKFTDRFQRMRQNYDYFILVAKDADAVVGFIGICKGIAFELEGEYMKIIALAVNKDYQHNGIGAQLIRNAEGYAIEQGIHYASVNSGLQRIDAHRFYEKNGYTKKGYSFKKVISICEA
jgi:GNAT superfamily N-acetyltransferase